MRASSRAADLITAIALTLLSVVVVYSVLTDDARTWYAVTLLGEEQLCMALAVTIYVLADVETGIVLAAVTVASGALCSLLKEALALPRPPPESWRVVVSGYAFPSGHATVSAAFWSSLLTARKRRILTLFSALAIASVSYSRLALGVHYPRDVIAGVLTGASLAAISHLLQSRLGPRMQVTLLSLASIALGLAGSSLYGNVNSYKVVGAALPLLTYPYLRKHKHIIARAGLAARILALAASLTAAAVALKLSAVVSTAPAATGVAYFCAVVLALYTPLPLLSIVSSPLRRRF